MEITKTTVLEVSQSSLMSSSAETSTAADDGEFQEQYDTVMKEVIVLDNSLVNKGQVTTEDLVGRPEDKTKVDNSVGILLALRTEHFTHIGRESCTN